MNDSYRATLVLVGIMLAVSIASWRLVQIETRTPREPSPPSMVQRQEMEVRPAPTENVPAAHQDPPEDRVAELIAAARRGNISAVLALVGKGENINATGADGLTPLLAAIRQGNVAPDVIEKLIRAGADATARDSRGRDALALAVGKDDINTIQVLLKHSRTLSGEASAALCDAAAQNHVEALQALLDSHVDVDKPDKQGRTALSSAIKQGDPDTVRFLLEHNADPNRKNSDGATPLILAVERGSRNLIQSLLDKNATINERNDKGETALMRAVRGENTEVARTLVDAGADVNLADSESTTPLMAAASSGRAGLVQLLLDKNARTDPKDSHDETALSLARKNGNNDIVDLLTKATPPDGG